MKKKILCFIVILFAAISAVFALASCGKKDSETSESSTDIVVEIPYVSDFTCNYYDSDNNQVNQNNVFSFDSVVLVKITFTLSAEANKVGKSKFTLKLTPSEGFTGRIVSANTSLTNNKDLTATFAADDKSKNCEIQAEIQFNYNSGELRIEYAYDDEEYASGGIAQLKNNATLIFEYDEELDGYTVSSYARFRENENDYGYNLDELIIPDTFNGKPVTVLGKFSDSWADVKLKKKVVPCSVTRIGEQAFRSFSSLIEIVLPDSITDIGKDAFYGCNALTKIDLPDGITSIGSGTFGNCKSLTDIKIPDSITSISGAMFMGCSSLTSVTIPDGVTEIGNNAFSGCSSLISVTIPEGVTEIESDAFCNCSSLTNITIPDSVTSIWSSAISGCDNLQYNEYGNAKYLGNEQNPYLALIGPANAYITSVEINESAKLIINRAFFGCSRLTSITIPDGINVINDGTFSDCSSLESVTLPDSITNIGNNAFYNCVNLTSITIPDSVTRIGVGAFNGCNSLTSITIPNSVTNIGVYAFYKCSSLTSITIPDSVTSMGSYAFAECSRLTSITIPDSVTKIGEEVFTHCVNLTSISFSGTKKQWLDYGIGEISETGPITVYCSDGEIKFKLN